VTVIVTTVFPIYYSSVAAAGMAPATATFRFGLTTTIGLLLIAICAPILGAIGDLAGIRKRMLAVFLFIGLGATACMCLIQRGDWLLASGLFVLANIGANGSFVFYDSLLPHVAREDEIDRLSTSGYALGYVGGGILLAFVLALIERPSWFGLPSGEGLSAGQSTLPARLGFVAVAVWWLLFSIPLFRHVREPAGGAGGASRSPWEAIRDGLRRMRLTFREMRRFRQAGLMLLAFLIYNDGIGTIVRMAAIYGAEIGIGRTELIGSILLAQFVGIPCSILFGLCAARVGARPMILAGLSVYGLISILGYFMTSSLHFFLLAVLVGLVQGGTQALSRSLFASMTPVERSAEFFGFFAVVEKFAGIFGPAFFSLAIALGGSSRGGILSIILFFIVGGAIFSLVDVREGRRAARGPEAGSQGVI